MNVAQSTPDAEIGTIVSVARTRRDRSLLRQLCTTGSNGYGPLKQGNGRRFRKATFTGTGVSHVGEMAVAHRFAHAHHGGRPTFYAATLRGIVAGQVGLTDPRSCTKFDRVTIESPPAILRKASSFPYAREAA